jgi:hypothetical protein
MSDADTRLKYINSELKVKFDLDPTSKPKPVAGPDDLLLLLTHHWARDESVFPTEDDRHDVATIMLFQAYTGARPAEFVHATKGKASLDPLGEGEEGGSKQPCERGDEDHDRADITDDGLESDYDDDSDAGNDPECDDDIFNYRDEDEDNTADNDDNDFSDKVVNAEADPDSGYSSDGTDVSMKGCGEEPAERNCNTAMFDEFGEATRTCKALCYEDIILWVVRNPVKGGRDVLAMEVYLRHHKGVDNKPKPCVALPFCVKPQLTLTYSTTFLFRENPLPILCPISHILTRAIRDDAILVDGYTSAKPFFATNLRGQGMKAMKVHWKPEWLKRPVFRRSVRPMGTWVKSKTEPMPYSAYAFYINRLGRNTGFEDELTSYCFRRGTANAIDG